MKKLSLILILTTFFTSCKKDFLDEKPTAFLSSTNAYTNYAGLNATVTNIYGLIRSEFIAAMR
ncbi:hypothetical protein [Mucilaginibacter mali]|uniref:hypothetical protein n=1 Tax=Mucilaginibacter mali TaxID=2740462 RepID=UPI00191F9DF3|nr:hypothetical protein [Mucilaginibacter mali]